MATEVKISSLKTYSEKLKKNHLLDETEWNDATARAIRGEKLTIEEARIFYEGLSSKKNITELQTAFQRSLARVITKNTDTPKPEITAKHRSVQETEKHSSNHPEKDDAQSPQLHEQEMSVAAPAQDSPAKPKPLNVKKKEEKQGLWGKFTGFFSRKKVKRTPEESAWYEGQKVQMMKIQGLIESHRSNAANEPRKTSFELDQALKLAQIGLSAAESVEAKKYPLPPELSSSAWQKQIADLTSKVHQ